VPTIFDLFGFPLDDRSASTEAIRKARQCPFMDAQCDGGGNRYQTEIQLGPAEPLTQYFNPGIQRVVPGVCSILTTTDTWVVCPRRLLAFRFTGEGLPSINHALQDYERDLLISAGLPQGVRMGLWSEVALKQRIADADINYHFDYVAAPLVETTLESILNDLGSTTMEIALEIRSLATLAKRSGCFPHGVEATGRTLALLPDIRTPFILEVMTASTSGSDTDNNTDMRSAFRNAILNNDHTSPGINKRQVWGRMVTQLFAKTALAKEWNGRTVWIIQDELLRNIELTTRLRTGSVLTSAQNNISLVVMHYRVSPEGGQRRMSFKTSIDGNAGIDFSGNDTFTDILLPKTAPRKIELLRALLRRQLGGIVVL
jgi:hypothetical protein